MKGATNDVEFENMCQIVEKEMKNTGKSYTKEDVEYWSKIIGENSKISNIPPEVLSAIIGHETKFTKHVNSATGAGPMQIVGTSVIDMFSNSDGGRLYVYNKIDDDMMNQILYKCDDNGVPIIDNKGNPIRKYKTAEELRNACTKDDDLAVKVGIMCLKMHYVNAAKKYTNASLISTIDQLKSKSFELTSSQQKEVLTKTLKTYNSVFQTYAPEVVDSIQNLNAAAVEDFTLCLQDKQKSFSANS